MFINSDTMMVVAKWSELNNFSFKLDKTFPEQLMKFDEQVLLLKELGGTISEQDNTFILIKALPLSYKEKLSNILSMQPGQKTYTEVRQLLLQIFERDMAWKTLFSDTGKDIPSIESGLFEMERGKERREKGRDKGDKWREKGGKGGKSGKGGFKRENHNSHNPPQQDFACFNCNKKDHYTMSCFLPLTVEAREKLWKYKKEKRNKGREKGGEKREDKEKRPRREREASCLALDAFPKAFLESPPPLPQICHKGPLQMSFSKILCFPLPRAMISRPTQFLLTAPLAQFVRRTLRIPEQKS
jgi:hypothetical protein